MEFDTIYNYTEIGLWAVIGLAFLIRAGMRSEFRALALTAGIAR